MTTENQSSYWLTPRRTWTIFFYCFFIFSCFGVFLASAKDFVISDLRWFLVLVFLRLFFSGVLYIQQCFSALIDEKTEFDCRSVLSSRVYNGFWILSLIAVICITTLMSLTEK